MHKEGLGILIAPAGTKTGKASMYDEEEGADEAPESERAEGKDGMMADLETLLGSADEDQLEAFKSLVRSCFDEYEQEPHAEGPHTNED